MYQSQIHCNQPIRLDENKEHNVPVADTVQINLYRWARVKVAMYLSQIHCNQPISLGVLGENREHNVPVTDTVQSISKAG